MRSKFKWIFTLLLALTMQFSFAQEKTVTGVVSDATGSLPGANVVVKGTTRGTQTDVDGKYSIQAKVGEVLVFSFVGMTDVTMTVGASNTISVELKQGVALTEVVIDGYKTTSKRKAAIAQTTVTSEEIEGRPNVSFLQSLQSQVAGLNIATSSGTPGSSKIDVILRGLSSINGNTEPLYVIDGVAGNQTIFRSLNNEDIESITVLKDAGATAIYGNRGANGVIVISTKKGKFNSKLSIRYNGSTGYSELQQNEYHFLNTRRLLALERTAGAGLGATGGNTPVPGSPMTDSEINSYPIDTQWRDYFFQTGISQSHSLSFTQGTENMTNFTSISYFDQEGIVPTTNFKRFTFRTNFTGKSTNDKFTYSTNTLLSFSRRNQLQAETSALNANVVQNPLQGLLSSLPYIDPNLYQSGQQLFDDYGTGDFTVTPLILLDYLQPGNIPNRYDETKILTNAMGSYKLTNDLTYSMTAGVDYVESKRNFARAPWSWLALAVQDSNGSEFGGIELFSSDRDFGFNYQNRLNYSKTFKEKHTIDANVFMEYVKAHRQVFQMQQDGLNPRTWALGAGTGWIAFNTATPNLYRPSVSAFKADAGLFSYFATVDYDYNAKYGIVGTIRRDASYKFTEDNTWGTFWSVSGRWNIDQEAFMQNTWFDGLKLRATYGTTGNQNILSAAYGANPIYLASNNIRDLNATGNGYEGFSGIGVANIANTDLRWETTAQGDIGLDFSIKRRFSGSIDVYKKKTTDLFDTDNISAINGQYGINGNADYYMTNTGVEVSFKYDVFKKGDFKLDVFFNASYNKNAVEGLTYPEGDDVINFGNVANQNGNPIFSYYVVPYVGVNPENGNLLFLDKDDNVTETVDDSDRRLTDKNSIPVYQGGFGLNASYKGFFLNSNFSWVTDIYRYDFDLLNSSSPTAIGSFNVVSELTQAWTIDNPNSPVPSLNATNLDAGDTYSDRFLRDASYVRLKNLIVGYEVPSKMLEKTFLTNVKVYTQLENYFTWSSWRGFDPEGLNASNQGGYPSPKVFSFGVDVQF
jgi:TonB-linked SusC/RagA family outer membrane protein